jgi:hypothetical protein
VDPKLPEVDVGDHLFQTHQGLSRSWSRYFKLLGVVAIPIVIAGAAIAYLTLPRYGDAVRAPQDLDDAVRNHFIVKEKRAVTDITFYYCDTYYWARVRVEKRPDITTNPIYLIDTYAARAESRDMATWAVTAAPITSPEQDVPCR